MIKIIKENESWIKILCDEKYQEIEIQDKFSFRIPNHKYDPRVRAGKWDGVKKLYNRNTKRFPLGILLLLLEFLSEKNYTYQLDEKLIPEHQNELQREDITNLIDNLIKPQTAHCEPLVPYDYQLEAIEYMLNMGRSVSLLATSGGKSLIIYILVRIYQLLDDMDGKIIFITVPSLGLVEQLYNDFKEYSQNTDWNVSNHVQKMGGKYSKQVSKKIVISTWQTQSKLPYETLNDIGCIIVDEAHTASAKVLGTMVESLINCEYKHGLTGTLSGMEADDTYIQGVLGLKKKFASVRDVIDLGNATELNINMVSLNHDMETVREINDFKNAFVTPRKKYEAELLFLNTHKPRIKLLLDMVNSIEGNSLVIFNRVEQYGKILYELYKDTYPEDKVFIITGEVEAEERECIRQSMEKYNNAKIFCSYGTMSTGVSIKKLHNCFLLNPGKSKKRVLQTLGRLMRLHETKKQANIYDIVDKIDENSYSLKQAIERVEIYNKEKLKVNYIDLDL